MLSFDIGLGIAIVVFVVWFVIINKRAKRKSYTKEEMEIIKDDYIDFLNLVKIYGKHLEVNPLSIEEIRNSNVLPFSKSKLLSYAPMYIKFLEKNIQEAALEAIPLLAFYKDNIPDNGYKSNIHNLVENGYKPDMNNLEESFNEIEKILSTTNNFPRDLHNECVEESMEIYETLKKAISLPLQFKK